LWVEFKNKNETYLLCNIYRPPNTSVEFWNRFNICLEKASELYSKIVTVGDINEDQLNLSNNKFRDILTLNNMENTITEPTRISLHSRTLLDPIGITRNISYLHSGIFETDKHISDHFGTFIFLKYVGDTQASYKRRVWNYKNANYITLNESIRNTDWSFLRNENINTAVLNFTNTILDLVKACIPYKFVTVRPRDRPWYNSDIRNTSRNRDRHKHIATISGKLSVWSR
jgi:hypothetical protein